MFSIEMLPAQQGDALWIEYGSATKPHRILVDGGTPPTAEAIRTRVGGMKPSDRSFELLIVTHIDTDHIGGILKLLADRTLGLTFDDVWFNAWPQIEGIGTGHTLGTAEEPDVDQVLGPVDGEILNRLLDFRGSALARGWNRAFGSARDTRVAIPDRGDLPVVTLPGGMRLTVLGPSLARLRKLRTNWEDVIRETKLTDAERDALVTAGARRRGLTLGTSDLPDAAAKKFSADTTPANGSSIIVLAEFEKKTALLTGDAYAGEIVKGVDRYLNGQTPRPDRLKVNLVKLPHHGSRKNTSVPMIEKLDCQRFLISSSGAIFKHPDREAIARVLVGRGPGVDLGFNYDVPTTQPWKNPILRNDAAFGYTARYPARAGEGLKTVL